MIVKEKIYINTNELGSNIGDFCKEFTYKNPEYAEKKRQKFSVKNIPTHLYHYAIENMMGNQMLILPRGGLKRVLKLYKEKDLPVNVIDRRVFHNSIDCSLVDTILDGNQHKIVDALCKNDGGLIEATPGGGKTISILGLIDKIKQPVLILVHEHRLSSQWIGEIQKRLSGNYSIGELNGEKKKDGDIVVGIINTVYIMFQENPEYFNKFGMIVLDECLDPDTIISLPQGFKKLKDIKKGDIVLTPKGTAKVKRVWKTVKKAYKYNISNNNYLIASENHIVHAFKQEHTGFVRGVTNKPIKDCSRLLYLRDILECKKLPEFDLDNYLYGWFVGDGTCDRGYIKFSFRKKKKIESFENIFNKYNIFSKFINSRGDHVYSLDNLYGKRFIEKFNIKDGKKDINLKLPDSIYYSSDISFLRGIFDTDGCRHINSGKGKQNSIELGLILKDTIYQISDMLKSYNIYHTVVKINRKNKNKKYNDVFRINIGKHYIENFNKIIGFGVSYKQEDPPEELINKSPFWSFSIKNVEYLGEQELIDIELDDEEKLFIANGFVVHNCHHSSAPMFHLVINNIPAKYRIGMTGTIERRDGKHILIYDTLGEKLIDIGAKDAKHRITNFDFKIINTNIRFEIPTTMRWTGHSRELVLDITGCISYLTKNSERNNLIVQEVSRAIEQGYYPLVLSDRIDHNKEMYKHLVSLGYKAVLLIGATRKSTKWEEIRQDTSIQCIVGNTKIASEALDLPRLSALFLTCPSSNLPQIKQRLGRVRRFVEKKPLPIVYDVCDNLASYLNSDGEAIYLLQMLALKRVKFYKKLIKEYDESGGLESVV